MATCPKCSGKNVRFHREPAGTSYKSYYRRTGVKNSWILPAGIRNGRRKISHRTVGVCSDCGYTWEVEDDSLNFSGWKFLFILICIGAWPITLSVWFWRTTAFRIARKWRFSILLVAWIALFAVVLSNEGIIGPDMNSVWASSYANLDDFEYYIDENEIYIKDYIGKRRKVRIKSSYDVDGTIMNVVSFDGTFALENVSSVIIPEGTQSMSNNVFNSCGVKYVYLPASLTQFDGWSYFHNVEKIYYGGTEEQWKTFCTVDRSRVDVVQIICNANPNDLE